MQDGVMSRLLTMSGETAKFPPCSIAKPQICALPPGAFPEPFFIFPFEATCFSTKLFFHFAYTEHLYQFKGTIVK